MVNQNLTSKEKVSKRGYYYDLSLSPYEFMGYKFPSAKKLEVFVNNYNFRVKKVIESYSNLVRYVDGVTSTENELLNVLIADKLYKELSKYF